MRRPHSRNCCAAFHLEVAHVIPGCTGFFPVQSNTKGMEHYIVQIAHVRKILHVASRFAKLIDGANLVVIDDGVLFCGGHGLRYKASRVSRSVFRILSVFAMQTPANAWVTPPGRMIISILENGLSLPAILFLVLFVCGLFFILTDNITD